MASGGLQLVQFHHLFSLKLFNTQGIRLKQEICITMLILEHPIGCSLSRVINALDEIRTRDPRPQPTRYKMMNLTRCSSKSLICHCHWVVYVFLISLLFTFLQSSLLLFQWCNIHFFISALVLYQPFPSGGEVPGVDFITCFAPYAQLW